MSDAEVLHEFTRRQQGWLQALQQLRAFHETRLGKVTTPVQWIAGRELGRYSWLGYYWHQEMIWFGYGLHGGEWTPLIEADNRSKCSEVFTSMRTQLSGTWESVEAEGNLYRRLWAPAKFVGPPERALGWWQARSRELHEYLVAPEA